MTEQVRESWSSQCCVYTLQSEIASLCAPLYLSETVMNNALKMLPVSFTLPDQKKQRNTSKLSLIQDKIITDSQCLESFVFVNHQMIRMCAD